MKNVRSVGNKVGMMKKKYGLPLGTGSGRVPVGEQSSPSVLKTTKTHKVIKSSPKKKVATSTKLLKAKVVKESEEEVDDTTEVEQEEVEEGDPAAEETEEELTVGEA
jgi:hypothetical protein